MLEKVLRSGLGDASPAVKTEARVAWGAFTHVWGVAGRKILDSLDGMAKKQLEKVNADLVGPSSGLPVPSASQIPAPRPKRLGMAAQIAAQRKLKEARERELEASTNFASLEPRSIELPVSPPTLTPTQLSSDVTSTTSVLDTPSSSFFSPSVTTPSPPDVSLPSPTASDPSSTLAFDATAFSSSSTVPQSLSNSPLQSSYEQPLADFESGIEPSTRYSPSSSTPPRGNPTSVPFDFFADSPSIRSLVHLVIPIRPVSPKLPEVDGVPTPVILDHQSSALQPESHASQTDDHTSPLRPALPVARSPPKTPVQSNHLSALRSAALFADSPPSWHASSSPRHSDLLRAGSLETPHWRRSLIGWSHALSHISHSCHFFLRGLIKFWHGSPLALDSSQPPQDSDVCIERLATGTLDAQEFGHLLHLSIQHPLTEASDISSVPVETVNVWKDRSFFDRVLSILQKGCREWVSAVQLSKMTAR